MSLTPSKSLPKGSLAPIFSLQDVVSQELKNLNDLKSNKATVIIFMCNHCPYVRHILPQLILVANEYISKGVSFIAINSNDIESFPEDSPQEMKKIANKLKFPFPYLFDKNQDVAKAYDAACTPEFYIFDKDLKRIYHGQFDDSRPGNDVPVTGSDLKKALNQMLNDEEIFSKQKPSTGCNIKWK